MSTERVCRTHLITHQPDEKPLTVHAGVIHVRAVRAPTFAVEAATLIPTGERRVLPPLR